MVVKLAGNMLAMKRGFRFGVIGLVGLVAGSLASGAEEKKPSPCTEDAMIVFDASGSMSGNMEGGIGTLKPRIDEVRNALAKILPEATRFRRMGLITYGPGPGEQCNVRLDLKPTANASSLIMRDLDALSPAGKTPLTIAVAKAAEVLDYRKKPRMIVVVTDGEETCGASPCELGKKLLDLANQPKHSFWATNADHNDMDLAKGYLEAIQVFAATLGKAEPASPPPLPAPKVP